MNQTIVILIWSSRKDLRLVINDDGSTKVFDSFTEAQQYIDDNDESDYYKIIET